MKLIDSLVSGLKATCAGFPDSRIGRTGNIATADFGLSADTDEAGHAFQYEAGHLFRFEAGHLQFAAAGQD